MPSAFAHLLVRDAAYESLPMARRSSAHEAVARWLDSTTAANVAPELVASHLERAVRYRDQLGDPAPVLAQEAAGRLVACAQRVGALGDFRSAQALLRTASDLVPTDSAAGLAITLARAAAAHDAGDYAAAEEWSAQAEKTATRTGDERTLWRARLLRNATRRDTDPDLDVGAAADLTDEAIAAFGALGDDSGLALAYDLRCHENNYFGHPDASAVDARVGLAAAARAREFSLVSSLLFHRMMPYTGGSATLAEEEQAIAELEREFGGEPLVAADLFVFGARLRADQGDLDGAIDAITSRATLDLEQGNPRRAARLFYAVGEYHKQAGDLTAAAASMLSAIEIFESIGETATRSTELAELAVVLSMDGREAEAREALHRSRVLSQAADSVNPIIHAIAEGLLSAHAGAGPESEAAFVRGLALLAPTDFDWCRRDLHLTRSAARQVLGDAAGSLASALEGLAIAKRQGFVPPLRAARARVAACQELLGSS